ncbi:MAG TPA: TIGR02587 family membrane protein [Gemmatimonadaceae bacterium]|nr:TIGR02587 family membrane protein [Gemmatimonadaceae bacterium]
MSESLREYGRGIAGGLLFSLPLLYTMEMWWAGIGVRPGRLIVYVLGTFVLLLGYNRYVGLRHDDSWREVAIDSVEEMGLGLAVSVLVLFLLGRLTGSDSAYEMMGKIIIEAMTVAIGVSVGTAQLGVLRHERLSGRGAPEMRGARPGKGKTDSGATWFGGQLVIGFCGAVLFAANIAPTEEIPMIAAQTSAWRLVGLSLLSVALGGLILYYSGFTGSDRHVSHGGVVNAVVGSVVTFAVGLVASALLLWFFGRFDGASPVLMIAQTLVLAFVATLGASAGRLLLQ